MVFALVVLVASRASAVVISEIHYNPGDGADALEFIELTNQTPIPADLSGFSFIDGVRFTFPHPTVLAPGERLVLAADADAVSAHYGIEGVLGNFEGRLDGSGERLTLVDQAGITVTSLRYRDRGKWPTAADGTGHSLILRDLLADSGEPENWTYSTELGGSPGLLNDPDDREIRFEVTVIVDLGEDWRFRRGDAAFSEPADAWREPDFNDADWELGPSGFGFGDDDDATVIEDMRGAYTSLAIRKNVELTAEDMEAEGEYFLGMAYDDGFCAFVNGVSVRGANCPEGAPWDGLATRSKEARTEELFAVPRELLREGANTIAIAGYNSTINSNDLSILPRFIRRKRLTDARAPRFDGTINELFRGDDESPAFVELYNRSNVSFDLTGVRLTTDPAQPGIAFEDGTMIGPRQFLVVEPGDALDVTTELVRVFLIHAEGYALAAEAFDDSPPERSALESWSEASFPDGAETQWLTGTPTPGEPNVVPREERIVISEIFYNPPEEREGEFIELLNRSDEAVDLTGFRFTRGVDFDFPAGTVLAAGERLVLAESADLLRDVYGYDGFVGEFEGQLANGGENLRLIDSNGNVVDEVRYFDGGEWSIWADGRGSSLELVDPRQDNDFPSAWEASDESDKSSWEELSYVAERYVPSGESELHLLFVERGECLIDDVTIRAGDGDENFVPNGDFEENTRGWRIEGTHVHSGRTTADKYSGEACLHLAASGKGDSGCNRIEADTSPRLPPGRVEVSMRARWLRGSSLLVAHGEFAAGPWFGTRDNNMSNNSLGGRLRLTVPRNLGTPGAENSARRILREETGSDNAGPVITGVEHSPANPREIDDLVVTARVFDADGLDSVVIHYHADVADPEPQQVAMFDDGEHGDGAAGDGVFAGEIPPFPDGTRILFWVEATDGTGVAREFPGPEEDRCVVRYHGSKPESLVILQSRESQLELARRPLHSNDLVDATVVFNDSKVYYNVGMRYRGSRGGGRSVKATA